jgi:surface protein
MFGTNAGKTLRNRVADLRHSVAGAIDLASIMVGVIVLGVIAGVIAATVFAVIPWAQDNAAKADLGAIRDAQSVARVQEGSFLTVPQLVEKGYLPAGTTASGDIGVNTASVGAPASVDTLMGSVDDAGDCYLAASTSATGKIFYTTSKSVDIHQYEAGVSVSDCGSISKLLNPAMMISSWDTRIAGCATITLPVNGAVTGTINWGDGVTAPLTALPTHTYTGTAGVKTVTIAGTFASWGATSGWTPNCVTAVTAWSGTETTSLANAFYLSTNLLTVAETPAGVTDMQLMMYNTSKFNTSVENFDTSKVTNMTNMFRNASIFNQPVSSFDTSNVTAMNGLFSNAYAFNQPVPFNTSKATVMHNMFDNARAFNQSVASFDTSNVTNLSFMFYYANVFNQPLSTFDTSKVTNMNYMFNEAPAFNQPLNTFDTGNVQTMNSMFAKAITFNQDISGWDVLDVYSAGSFRLNSALTDANTPVKFR